MASIEEVYNLWANLDFQKIVDDSIKENESVIIDVQREQMRSGVAADGKMIGQYSGSELSKAYQAIKNSLGRQSPAPSGYVNLFNEEDFQRGIKLEYAKDFIMPISSDSKEGELVERYGERIYGLTNERLAVVNQNNILPIIQKKLKDALKV